MSKTLNELFKEVYGDAIAGLINDKSPIGRQKDLVEARKRYTIFRGFYGFSVYKKEGVYLFNYDTLEQAISKCNELNFNDDVNDILNGII